MLPYDLRLPKRFVDRVTWAWHISWDNRRFLRLLMIPITPVALLVIVVLSVLPLSASAWNIPGHMLSGAIAYQILQQENPPTIDMVKAVLEKHPWYANQWQARLRDASVADHTLVLFMQAARWADDIRIRDGQTQISTFTIRLTSLTPKHSVIASGGGVCSEVLVCPS
jgi:hypothetical protein